MQRDTDFTFEDIVGSPDIHDSDISKYGATGMEAPDSTDMLRKLRFLRVPELDPDFGANDVTYTITDGGQYPEVVDYIAVSYCWNSFSQTNTALSDSAPTVSVIDQGVRRSPRCPTEVIFRAVNFAHARGVSLIWIDQECINQMDDADVQQHLQCMHTIYKQAKFAIGLLNFELTNWGQFMALMRFTAVTNHIEQHFDTANSPPEFLLNVKNIKFITRLLKSVRRDPWFSRTWVFQERYSAQLNMHLLFRVSSEVRASLMASNYIGPFWADVALPVHKIGSIPALWSFLLKQTSTETIELQLSLEALHEAAQSVCTDFDGAPIELLISVLLTGQNPQESQRPADGFRLKAIFQYIESCDNQVVSDRVAVFANVAELEWRINTTGLSSYSLSLLAVLHINDYLPRVLIRQDDKIEFRSPFILDVQTLALVHQAIELRYLIRNGHKGLDEDLQAVDETLAEFLPVGARQHETAKAFIMHCQEDGQNHDLLPLLASPAGNIKAATIIPVSATIEGLFGGIMKDTSVKRAGLFHSCGNKIVRYAVKSGQLPEGSTFLAFHGAYNWSPKFIDEHFVA
ncbi:heterokaryon incompatibility protein-domain-containing protein [Halenospora varia]|nr:heterokaryon incompatibility protein-domain-containing protein [Halenospora varia]